MHVLYSFPHPLGRPGIGTTALYQVRGLVEAGVDVTLVCTSIATPVPGAVTVVQTMRRLGRRIPHRAFGSAQHGYDFHDRMAARQVRRSIHSTGPSGPIDVVHTWPRGCLRTLAAATAAEITSVREAPNAHTRSVFEQSERAAHDCGVPLTANHTHRWDAAVLRREETEYSACDYLLAPSSYVVDSFTAQGFPAERLIRTRYGFDEKRFGPGRRLAGTPFTAVFLGRGDPTKGLHVALQAWRKSGLGRQGGQLLVAGRIADGYAAAMGELLTEQGVRPLGFVAAPERLLAEADVLLLPTFTEGSALVTYEAVGSGCVPLVSEAAGAPVRDGVEGLLHPVGDDAVLAGQLRRLIEEPRLLAELRGGCLARAPELTWRTAGRVLADSYLLARQNRSRPDL